MSRRHDGSDRGVLISRESLSRVAKQGHRADDSRRNSYAPPIRTAFGDDGGMRLGKTTSDWDKGTLAEIDIYERGTPPNEQKSGTETVAGVVNKFADVASGKWVMIAQAGNGEWYLIAAEC